MRRFDLTTVVVFLALITLSASSRAQTGVSDDRVSLPDGPGSLDGLGDNVNTDSNMGTLSYSVGFEVPQGFEGATPSLGLQYNSGGGNGVVGMGWSMPIPFIERMTRKGLPDYDGDDLFVADGGTELIRLDTAEPATFRARFEGAFVRYQWHNRGLGDEGHWTAEYPNGNVAYFGADASGTPEPLAQVRAAGGIFRYLLVEEVDVFGHKVTYDYTYYGSQPLIDFIGWGHDGGGMPRFSVTFDYEARDDRISDARGGFNDLLAHRLTNADVWVGGTKVRSYGLSYEPYADAGHFSRLSQVQQYGSAGGAHPIAYSFGYSRALAGVCDGVVCEAPYLVTMNSLGVNLQSGQATLVDLNGDALPDVVHTPDGAAHRIFLAQMQADGTHIFSAATNSAVGTTTGHDLKSPYVQVLDANGDGFADLLSATTAEVLLNQGGGDWDSVTTLSGGGNGTGSLPDFGEDFTLGADTELKHIQFLDYDGDRLIDVMRSTDVSTQIYRNLGNGGFEEDVNVAAIGAGFDTENLELADMNGDGLLDPVILRDGQISHRINLGHGQWAAWVDIDNAPITTAELPFAQMEDINGDGTDDLVVVQSGEVRYALNRNAETFSVVQSITTLGTDAIPDRDATTTVLFADMNANGSNDVVWITAAGQVTYLELFPVRPHLLSRIENGLGFVSDISYGTAAEARVASGGAGWDHPIPHSMVMIRAVDTYADAVNPSDILHEQTDYSYSGGYYNGDEKRFAGFSQITRETQAHASQEAVTSVREFDVGEPDMGGPRPQWAGRLLRDVISGANGALGETVHEYAACALDGIPPAVANDIHWVCKTGTTHTVKEARPQNEWVQKETTLEYDGYGNVTTRTNHGVVSVGGGACGTCALPGHHSGPCGAQCTGDEEIVETTYIPLANTGGRWILGAPSRILEKNTAAAPGTERIYLYDGPAFEGLAEGTLEKGAVTRVILRDPQSGDSIDEERHRLNSHGNSTEILDPEADPMGVGHRSFYTYDSSGLDLVREEQDRGDLILARDLTWHPLFPEIESATDWYPTTGTPGPQVQYAFDEFGRVESVVLPGGDTPASPSIVYTYELGSPLSRVLTQQRSEVGGPLDLESVLCTDGLGRLVQSKVKVDDGVYQVGRTSIYNPRGHASAVHDAHRSATNACDGSLPSTPATEFRYDAIGRLVETRYPDDGLYGTHSMATREYLPLQVVHRDAVGSEAGGTFEGSERFGRTDGLGRSVQIGVRFSNGDEETTRFGYDDRGHVSAFEDRDGRLRTQQWNAFGRIAQQTDPDRGTSSFTYDDNGNLRLETTATGATIERTYDPLGRMTAEWDQADEMGTKRTWLFDQDPDCPTCAFNMGGLVGATYPLPEDSSGKDRLEYDERGRVVRAARTIMGVELTIENAFDNADRLIQTTYPGGKTVSFEPNKASQITGIPGYVPTVTYDDQGHAETLLLANGLTESRQLDSRNRIANLDVSGGGVDVLNLDFGWGRADTLESVADALAGTGASLNATYGYDAFGRLTGATLDSGSAMEEILTYGLDEGAMTSKTSSLMGSSLAHVGTITLGGANAGALAATAADGFSATYDSAGRMISRNGLDYTRDALGQVVETLEGSTVLSRYGYGAGGGRVFEDHGAHFRIHHLTGLQIKDGIAYIQVGNQGPPLVEHGYDDLLTQFFTDDGDGVINAKDAWAARDGTDAEIDRILQASARRNTLGDDGEEKVFLHRNNLGSVVAVSTEDGSVSERLVYYPYGTLRESSAGAATEYAVFAHLARDPTTGLYVAQARDYDPMVGRWTAPDPAFGYFSASESSLQSDLQSPYGYLDASPTLGVDTTGTWIDTASAQNPSLSSPSQLQGNLGSVIVEGRVYSRTPPPHVQRIQQQMRQIALAAPAARQATTSQSQSHYGRIPARVVENASPAYGRIPRVVSEMEVIYAKTPAIVSTPSDSGESIYAKTPVLDGQKDLSAHQGPFPEVLAAEQQARQRPVNLWHNDRAIPSTAEGTSSKSGHAAVQNSRISLGKRVKKFGSKSASKFKRLGSKARKAAKRAGKALKKNYKNVRNRVRGGRR
jgi:RHS repeat-associated protein